MVLRAQCGPLLRQSSATRRYQLNSKQAPKYMDVSHVSPKNTKERQTELPFFLVARPVPGRTRLTASWCCLEGRAPRRQNDPGTPQGVHRYLANVSFVPCGPLPSAGKKAGQYGLKPARTASFPSDWSDKTCEFSLPACYRWPAATHSALPSPPASERRQDAPACRPMRPPGPQVPDGPESA